jgi:hypothetical protein
LWTEGALAKAGQAIDRAKTNTPKPAARQAHPNEFSKQKKAMKKADPYSTVKMHQADLLGLYGQVNKRIRWMPRQ